MIKKIKAVLVSDIFWKKIIAYGLLVWILYWLKDFWLIFLLTFLFAWLFFSLAKSIYKFLQKKIKNERILKFLNINFIVSILYLLFIFWIIYFISNLVPLLISELTNLSKHIPIISDYINQITQNLKQVQHAKEVVWTDINKLMNEKNMEIIINIINHIKHFWWEIFKVILAFILSYFFIIDRKRLHKYLEWIKSSSVWFLYYEYAFLFKKIAKWFLLVFRAQAKIALVNTFLTWIWLHIIWFLLGQPLPYLWLLTAMVFIFSFIPVLWAIISSIPIALIAYNIWWFMGVVYVVILISIIHAIEAYILNPRFISEEVELPISLTFLLLIIWEHFFGPIWLIIAVPTFYIFVEIISDFDKSFSENKIA